MKFVRLGFIFLFTFSIHSTPSLGLSAEDQTLFDKTKLKLLNRGDMIVRTLERIGNQTIELEAFVALETELKMAGRIFSDFAQFETWAMPGINDRPSGGKYYVRILEIKSDAKDRITMKLALTLPVFKRNVICPFKLSTRTERDVFTFRADSIAQEGSIVHYARGTMKFFQDSSNPHRLWVYLKGQVNLKHWILYETFPLPYIARETGDRIMIVMDNYLKEESRIRSQSSSLAKGNGAKP